jgi:two-component system LytT family response regulator
MFKTLIIDDEFHQQQLLADLLKQHFPQAQLLGAGASVEEGVSKIRQLKPDLVFLDINMPPRSGFELLQEIQPIDFAFVFTTGYDTYALKAFEVSAVDYLLKPFGIDQLQRAIQRFEKEFTLKQSLESIKTLLMNLTQRNSTFLRIALPTANGLRFVLINDIIRCRADGNYAWFYFNDKTEMLVTRQLGECEMLLSGNQFFRAHHSHLLNLNYAMEYVRGDGGYIKMTDGSTVEVSRSRKESLMRLLQK